MKTRLLTKLSLPLTVQRARRAAYAFAASLWLTTLAVAQVPTADRESRPAPSAPIVPRSPLGLQNDGPREKPPRTGPLVATRLALTGLRFVGYTPDGKSVRVGSTNGRFQTLAVSTLAPLAEAESLPPYGTAAAFITRDKRWTAVGNWRGFTVVFDSQNLEVSAEVPEDPEVDPTPVTALKFDDKANVLVTGQRSSIVRLHALKDSSRSWESAKLGQEISGIDLSSDGRFVAVATGLLKDFNAPGQLVTLRATDGKALFPPVEMSSKVNAVAISPDAKRILAADNLTLRSYDVDGKLLDSIRLGGVQRIKFIDSDRIILSQYPGELSIWNIAERRLETSFTGHAKNPELKDSQLIWALDIAPDGRAFASADTHGNVGIWLIPSARSKGQVEK